MRIAFGSDLHHEFWNRFDVEPCPFMMDADVLVVAGDAGVGLTPIKEVHARHADQVDRILYLPGNHEYYRQSMPKLDAALAEVCADLGVVLLQPDTVHAENGVRFVGATLWTDYRYGGNRMMNMMNAESGLNDHRLIKIDRSPWKFLPKHAAERHARDLAWIMGVVAEPHDGPTVVVSHHAPHHNSIAPDYVRSDINACYVSDILEEPLPGPIAAWIHGHVHAPMDYTINGVRVVANPRAYPGELYNRPGQYGFRVIEV